MTPNSCNKKPLWTLIVCLFVVALIVVTDMCGVMKAKEDSEQNGVSVSTPSLAYTRGATPRLSTRGGPTDVTTRKLSFSDSEEYTITYVDANGVKQYLIYDLDTHLAHIEPRGSAVCITWNLYEVPQLQGYTIRSAPTAEPRVLGLDESLNHVRIADIWNIPKHVWKITPTSDGDGYFIYYPFNGQNYYLMVVHDPTIPANIADVMLDMNNCYRWQIVKW